MKYNKIAVLAATMLIATGASAQATNPLLLACKAKVEGLEKSIDAVIKKGRAVGNISPTEDAEFKKLDAKTKEHLATMKKGGLTMKECETAEKELAVELVKVTAMAATKKDLPDPKLIACKAEVAGLQKAIATAMSQGRAKGNIAPNEEEVFKRVDANVQKHITNLKKDGLTLGECEMAKADLAKESALVAVMASTKTDVIKAGADAAKAAPELKACAEANVNKAKAIAATIARGRLLQTITAAEKAELDKMEKAIADHTKNLAKDGFSVADCKKIGSDLDGMQAKATQMAAKK